jgi:pimeloyl-ACP methyl ester carboxylesterase
MRAILACLVLSLLVFSASAAPYPHPGVVTADPPADKANPARMQVALIDSHGSRMNAVFYLASGAGPHPTLVLFHGFPGNEQNLDLAQAVRRAGFNVLTLHYRGSWGSPGTFSFAHVLEDADAAVAFVRDPAHAKDYRIDPNRIFVAGHSMGGFAAGWAVGHAKDVKGLVMISGADMGSITPDMVKGDERKEWEEDIIPLVGCTVDGLIAEAQANTATWKFQSWVPLLKDRPALLISSNDGLQPSAEALAEALRKAGDADVQTRHFDTDHPYSDKRLALTSTVVDWLSDHAK